MDPSAWSPYSQQPYTHGNGGSPQGLILPPTPSDDTLNSYGSGNPHPLLMSPCSGLQTMPPRPNTADHSSTQLLSSQYEPTLLTPPVPSSKETPDYYSDNIYNGVCKENNVGMQDFGPSPNMPSRTDAMGLENPSFNPQVPPVSFQASDIDKPSPGPFGVLPHEAVMPRANRYDRSKDKFATPASKPVSTMYNSVPYQEQDVNSVYTSTPLSTHSVFSNENASCSPVVNSVTSPNMSNFSSPSEYYSSPKNNFGAYNNLQSPVPQSPSVAQHSYPNSPFTNLDPVSHISSAPPCSPMSGGSYVNKISDRGVIGSQVPQRNGHTSQHSPSNMTGNNVCYPQQSQAMVHHGHQPPPPVSKTSEYHSDYNVFPHNHVSPSSYPSVYPAIHSSQITCDDPSMTRPHGSHNMPHHDNHMQYPHSSPLPSANIESPTYLQGKGTSSRHDMYNSCSGLPPGQTMHPSGYQDCSSVIDPMRSHSLHTHHPHQQHHSNSMMPPMMSNDRHYGYHHSDMTDEKNTLDMFNSHIDSGVHNPDVQSSISSFLDGDLPMLEPEILPNRDMRIPESNPPTHHSSLPPPPPLSAMNMDNSDHRLHNRQMPPYPNIPNPEMPVKNINYPYYSSADMYRGPGNLTFNSAPRRRGRRGRRRKADGFNHSNTYNNYRGYTKPDPNAVYNNGYQINHMKYPPPPPQYRNDSYYTSSEYRNNCFNNYPKSYKERLDAYEFHTTYYAPSKYQSLRKRDENQLQNNAEIYKRPKRYISVEEDLRFLGEMKFPEEEIKDSPHTFMKTRNKDSEGFLQCYKNFLELRKMRRPDDEDIEVITSPKEHKVEKEHHHHHHHHHHKEKKAHKHVPKLTIKLGRCNTPGEWRVDKTHMSPEPVSDSDESASSDSVKNSSSHTGTNVYLEKMREKSKHTGHLEDDEKPPPKKRGRKAKNPHLKNKSLFSSSPSFDDDPLKRLSHPIKEEILSDLEEEIPDDLMERRSSLRSQRADAMTTKEIEEEPKPGPSIKIEPPDFSSDEIDILDDSDSDPVWTPTARTPRGIPRICEALKNNPLNPTIKKPRRKYTRRNSSSGGGPIIRRKRGCHNNASRRGGKTPVCAKKAKLLDPEIKVKTERRTDFFVIAKSDLGKDKAPIWRVDTDMKMLQRFDQHEEQGVLVYRNTYTYAAWNDVTEGYYLKVKVKVLSFSKMLYVVEYLGLDETSGKSCDPTQPHIVNPLRENFEVFLQTLISQALDPNFLSEITSENDDYFLSNIKEIEKITEEKKAMLIKSTWDKELQRCLELYPCINILPRTDTSDLKCQICDAAKSDKLVQFYGPPYDSTTLGKTENPLSNKTRFHVCAICSTTMSLYSRLHHQKYNFFVKCRTKMNQVKGDKSIESHVLLEHCLQDSLWVNMLFHELEQVWKECDKLS